MFFLAYGNIKQRLIWRNTCLAPLAQKKKKAQHKCLKPTFFFHSQLALFFHKDPYLGHNLWHLWDSRFKIAAKTEQNMFL